MVTTEVGVGMLAVDGKGDGAGAVGAMHRDAAPQESREHLGRRVAVLFTKTYGRVLAPGLSALDPRLPEDVSVRSSLATAWRRLERILDDFIQTQLVAA